MQIIKRNQLVILVISLMLVTAGYLNYTDRVKKEALQTSGGIEIAEIGDATLVSSQAIEENTSIESSVSSVNEENNTEAETLKQLDATEQTTNDDYFASSKLERDIMYSRNIRELSKNVRF